jgi:hypothetical protein
LCLAGKWRFSATAKKYIERDGVWMMLELEVNRNCFEVLQTLCRLKDN